jgi:predicted NUDIX family NTP pyrophosphohydrolase
MTAKRSAGILLHRSRNGEPEVFLVHPGGPVWAKKDAGAWSLPKGEFEDGEEPAATALREFEEETGHRVAGDMVPLEPGRQRGGKIVHAWAMSGDVDASDIRSNVFSMEWPPRSGRQREFPEVDRAGWFTLEQARGKINPGQRSFLDQLEQLLGKSGQRQR